MKDEDYFASMLAKTLEQDEDNMHVVLRDQQIADFLELSVEELERFNSFVATLTHQSIISGIASGAIDTKTDSYEGAIVQISALTTFLMAKSFFKEIEIKRLDDEHSKYPVTLMAEAHVRHYRTSGDLDAIWPTEVVKEVLEEFSPEEAFMVGVVCGKSHG